MPNTPNSGKIVSTPPLALLCCFAYAQHAKGRLLFQAVPPFSPVTGAVPEWHKEINNALSSTKVAILLVSPNFLASDFIAEHELHPLLKAARNNGLIICWIAIRNCLYQVTEIERFQALNDPSEPLATLGLRARDNVLVNICKQIKAATEPGYKEIEMEKPQTAAPGVGRPDWHNFAWEIHNGPNIDTRPYSD